MVPFTGGSTFRANSLTLASDFFYFYGSAESSDQAGSKITKLAYLDPLGEGFVNASELSASPTHLLYENLARIVVLSVPLTPLPARFSLVLSPL